MVKLKCKFGWGEQIKETPEGRWVGVSLTHHHLMAEAT